LQAVGLGHAVIISSHPHQDRAFTLMVERLRRGMLDLIRKEHAMSNALCTLQYAVGRTESCPGEGCPFWEDEVEIGCVVEPIKRQLIEQPELAQHLLELRANLDHARHDVSEEANRRLFYHLLNEEQGAECSEATSA